MGHGMARRFLEEGAEVLLVDYDGAALEAAETALRPLGPVRSFTYDLSERDNIRRLKDDVAATAGRVDILVNNAGVVSGGAYEAIDPAADARMLAVNVEAVHWMTKAFLPDLIAAPEGHLVQMASAAAFIGIPYQAVYCASKWFVVGLSESIRQELRDQGHRHVHLTIVCPSLVDTGMFAGARPPRLVPLLPPDVVVDKVVTAVRRNRLYIREPFMVKLTPFLRAILPTRVYDATADVFGLRRLMSHFRGRTG